MNLYKQLFLCMASVVLISGCSKQETPVHNENHHEVHSEHHAEHKDSDSVETKSDIKREKTSITGLSYANAVARASIPGQKVSAIYMTLFNDTDNDIELATVKSDVAGVTEFHTMEMDGSIMSMRKMEKVIVPAKGKFVFRKGAEHIMLLQLNKAIEAGQTVALEITTQPGGSIKLSVPVKELGVQTHDHGNMNHEEHKDNTMKESHEHHHE